MYRRKTSKTRKERGVKYVRLWFVVLLAALVLRAAPESDDDADDVTADDVLYRTVANCRYMFDVGTAGGADTMEEFDDAE